MKKSMKIFVLLGLLLATLVAMSSCSEKLPKIAIVQISTHDALDRAREGILEGLKEKGLINGENIKISIYNPEGDLSALATMSSQVVGEADLIFAISTPVAKNLLNECKKQVVDTPIIFTAITDPISCGLLKDISAPEGQITGTSDLNCVEDQIDLLREMNPKAKKLGIMWMSNEENSILQMELAKKYAKEINLEVSLQAITQPADIYAATNSLISDNVDAIYVPTDNTLASNITTIVNVTNLNGIPTICGESGPVEAGGTITLGLDYKLIGKQAGIMGAKVFSKEATISSLPVEYAKTYQLVINKTVADKAGIVIPASILDRADKII